MNRKEKGHELPEMWNKDGGRGLPRMRLPCDKVLQEETAQQFFHLHYRVIAEKPEARIERSVRKWQ